jgi:hypothetical protein
LHSVASLDAIFGQPAAVDLHTLFRETDFRDLEFVGLQVEPFRLAADVGPPVKPPTRVVL